MNISERIKELREEKEWSQRDLAIAASLTPQCISLIERGAREPGISTAVSIAKALSVSIDYLIGNDEPKNHYNEIVISRQEQELILAFRNLSNGMKKNIVEMIYGLSGSGSASSKKNIG